MAVPKNATLHRNAPLKSGVMLGVSPSSDPTFDVEVARATSGVYETIARLTPKGAGIPVSYTDVLPVTTGTFSYKARAVKEGYLAGDYTAVVTARPIFLPEIPPPITPLTGKGIGAPLFISTGASPTYGQANLSDYVQKTLRVGATEFVPTNETVAFSRGVGTLIPTTRNPSTAYQWDATVELPTGVTIDRVAFQVYRETTAQTVGVAFYSISTNGSATLRYSKTSTQAGVVDHVLSSSSFSFAVSNNYVVARVALEDSTGGNKAALSALSIRYRTPSLKDVV